MYWHHIVRPFARSQQENVFLAKVNLRQGLGSGQGSNCRTHTICGHSMLISEMTIDIFSKAEFGIITCKISSFFTEGFISVDVFHLSVTEFED